MGSRLSNTVAYADARLTTMSLTNEVLPLLRVGVLRVRVGGLKGTVASKTAPIFACFLKTWVLWLNEWIIFKNSFCVLNYIILTF